MDAQLHNLSIQQLGLLSSIITCLKDHISSHQEHTAVANAPWALPAPVLNFCADALDESPMTIENTWEALRDTLWTSEEDEFQDRTSPFVRDGHLLDYFLAHGIKYELGLYSILPPTRVCIDSRCDKILANGTRVPRELTKPISYEATLFTKNLGPIPAWSQSSHCRHCYTRYHADYYVHEHGSKRTYYYGKVPQVIEVSKHRYVERELCERFTHSMATAWVSATNNARLYNLEAEGHATPLSRVWNHSVELNAETVWDSFFLNGLLLDFKDRKDTLELDNNTVDHATRLRPAIQARNERMVGPGQELWNHACEVCCASREIDGRVQMLRAVVTDGVTIGHPCCGVHDCKEPLRSQRNRFCPTHWDKNTECAVVGCTNAMSPSHTTCAEPDHRSLETRGVEAHTAMFQLRRRLERLKVYHPEDEGDTIEAGEALATGEVVEIEDDNHPNKPESGNRKVRARFGRRRTHNEQLCVTTCGIILGRATMYGSEGVNGVRLFHRVLFPTKASLPGVIFYDNNCHMKALVDSLGDTYFDNCALPVDVFHMKTKHKESDGDCNRLCNPALFKDLMVDDKWRFNSSAAEITNAWFGGFQSMVREMRVDRYNFFLDEMIKRRNRTTVKDLFRRHARPYQIPILDLLA
ncbi:hypothetical protein HWV62_28773 [Athelia sp. TMB]|nr:hypothetical protein HWV62_28773 [Athelia sp. TMB]